MALMSPEGLRPFIANWPEVALHFLRGVPCRGSARFTSNVACTTSGRSRCLRINNADLPLTSIGLPPEGCQMRKSPAEELNAEILDDVPGALWSRTLLEETRWPPHKAVPDPLIRMERVGSLALTGRA
jgi:hypothetical protein